MFDSNFATLHADGIREFRRSFRDQVPHEINVFVVRGRVEVNVFQGSSAEPFAFRFTRHGQIAGL